MLTSSDQVDDRPERRAYFVVLISLLLAVIVVWAVMGATDGFRRVAFPTVVVVHAVLVVGVVTRRLPLGLVGAWLVAFTAALLFGRMATWEAELVARPADVGGSVTTVLGWFGILYAMAFLVFGTRRGAIVSLSGFVGLYVAVGLSWSWGMLAEANSSHLLAFTPVTHATLIAIIWVLARNVERLAAVRTTAELLQLQASTDPLTGVANRRCLDDELARLVAEALRYDQPLSVILIDLDYFKDVNDTHGHHVGDEVLVDTVHRLQATIRDSDLLGRWGGEEFLLTATHTDHQAACALAERCRRAITRSPMKSSGVTMTASLGVASLAPDDDVRTLMRRADLAMYTAKSDGRDRVVGMPDVSYAEATETSAQSSETHGQV